VIKLLLLKTFNNQRLLNRSYRPGKKKKLRSTKAGVKKFLSSGASDEVILSFFFWFFNLSRAKLKSRTKAREEKPKAVGNTCYFIEDDEVIGCGATCYLRRSRRRRSNWSEP
jgi:hypothetical protein